MKFCRRSITATVFVAAIGICTAGWAQPAPAPRAEPGEIILPVEGAPRPNPQAEEWFGKPGERGVHNVAVPTLTPFLPEPGKANGTAVIVAPGGGFMSLSMDTEGYDVARWLASKGVAAFVLKYRLDPTPATPEGLRTYAIGIFNGGPDKLGGLLERGAPPAIADAAAAVRLVRADASKWNIDPKKVGFMGFSAGAITVLGVTLQIDAAARPDFIMPIYGPMGRPDQALPKPLPPMWTALSADDPLFAKTDFGLVSAWRDAGGLVELHYYENGNHGWGFSGRKGTTTTAWPDHLLGWLQAHGWVAR